MNGDPKLYELLDQLGIEYQYIEHPEAPTIEIAKQYWAGHDARHCKNLFFRNHKGNQHYLGVKPGSVTPFGLINDAEHHVIVFVDRNLQQAEQVSYHPCENTASLIIKRTDLERFLDYQGNRWEWIELY